MSSFSKTDFLLKKETLKLLSILHESCKDDLSLAKSPLLGSYSSRERAALLEQRSLRKLASKKFSFSEKLLFSKLALEQSTREVISRYKAEKIGTSFQTIADLCCGIGGDSFFLKSRVIGVDKTFSLCRLYSHNMQQLGHNFTVIQSLVESCPVKAPMILLDPARRVSPYGNSWNDDKLSPSLEHISNMLGNFDNAAIKLRPGITVPEFLLEGEVEYIGLHDECLELLVWLGDNWKKGVVRATEVHSGQSLALEVESIADTFVSSRTPGKYLYEPLKVLVRSHLFGYLAQQLKLWQIDERIAYLSGDEEIRHPFLKGYRILDGIPYNIKGLKELLRQYNIGWLDIKKRGCSVDPQVMRKELKPKGDNRGIVFFTRVKNRKFIFLTEMI